MDDSGINTVLNALPQLIRTHISSLQNNSLPTTANVKLNPVLPSLPSTGLGTTKTFEHLQSSILPNLAQGHAGPRYYGFVTGGVTPAALIADYLVSTYDQNVQVHLQQSISTHVERATIVMLCELLNLEGFNGTITTGATAGNILGIACGREAMHFKRSRQRVSLTGAGKTEVLCAGGHSSISKACSILGVGRDNCIDLTSKEHPASFDINQLLERLHHNEVENIASVVVATFGEVNTGAFTRQIDYIHGICQKYNAWLHIDAAFGILARIHPRKQKLSKNLELADSISFDGHKFFNVPYDCGVYLTKDIKTLTAVCGNTGAAYLTSSVDEISPLNVSLENSRRFRGLPLYASLLSLGKEGYIDVVQRCCAFAKAIGKKIDESEKFRLLREVEFNIVLFQAERHEDIPANERIKDAINQTGKIYISGTTWNNEGALRMAVCNHLTPSDAQEEATQILAILENVYTTIS